MTTNTSDFGLLLKKFWGMELIVFGVLAMRSDSSIARPASQPDSSPLASSLLSVAWDFSR
jgi:hypothetical protein